ncbi:TPA: hypothetical protein PTV74_001123 [Clostridium botulinum]|uniref:hypothetical protein n=1 Tax=Clostridium botulinum TaxID=1491 RepID=UPI000D0D6233|nr:hypothetical protein [Clostridium botulinum]PSM01500.1 hypothetical protein C6C12_10205 [Clostridium botulinum]HDK7136691.1 hypothetical protein [Clostridium botulinum]HDK7140156.1 hypothetical protein [Clostridium botulinum]HDK7140324.1 hypothetical protein [Clostridium botulinum]HDK7143827.1 hypothetical protein [Clostridium botulinum]
MTKDRLKCIILSHKRIAIVTILFVLIILYIMFSLLMNGTKNLNIEHEIVENSNGVMRILIQDSLSEDEKRNLIDYYIKDYLKNGSENEKNIYLVDKNFKAYKGGVYGEGFSNKTFQGVGKFNKIIFLYLREEKKPTDKDFLISQKYNYYLKQEKDNPKYKLSKEFNVSINNIENSLERVEHYSRPYIKREGVKQYKASSMLLFLLTNKEYKEVRK